MTTLKSFADLIPAKTAGRGKNPFADLIPDRKKQFDAAFEGQADGGKPLQTAIDQKAANVPGTFESTLLGVGEGGSLGWWDELISLADEEAGKRIKERLRLARELHPVATGIGEVGGVVGTSLLVPGSTAVRGAALGAKMLAGARTGAITGSVLGAGQGEGTVDKVVGGLSGAVTGGVTGGIAPVALAGVGKVAKAVAAPFKPLRAIAKNTSGEAARVERDAARRVVNAIGEDTGGKPQRAVAMLQNAQRQGAPLIVADTGTAAGGRATQDLMRSAANTSPAARAALEPILSNRFGTQNTRAAAVLSNLVRTPANATLTREALDTAARNARKPFYDRAYRDGAGGVWNAELEALTASPVMQKAIRDAGTSIQNKTAAGRAMSPKSANGTPTLEFWDQVKRNLDSAWSVAGRAGDKELAGDIAAIKTTLIGQLDAAVPSYPIARGVAATLFKADDALSAGEEAVASRMSNTEISRGLSKMGPEEKALFREGFVSRFVDNVQRTSDRSSILKQIQANPQARERVNLVLGPGASQKLDALITVEGVMEATTNAMGNSNTARQLFSLGLAGGVGVSGAAGYVLGGGDVTDVKTWLPLALLAGARKGNLLIDQRVAKRVGEMLASEDPQTLQKAIDLVARNPRMLDAFRKIEAFITRMSGAGGATGAGGLTAPVGAQQNNGPDGNSD